MPDLPVSRLDGQVHGEVFLSVMIAYDLNSTPAAISDYRSHNAPFRRLNRRGGYFSSAIILRARLRPFSVSV